jgi:hypothetical protein
MTKIVKKGQEEDDEYESLLESSVLYSDYLDGMQIVGVQVVKMPLGGNKRDQKKPVKNISVVDQLLSEDPVKSLDEDVPCLMLSRTPKTKLKAKEIADATMPLLCPVCGGPAHIDVGVVQGLDKLLKGFLIAYLEIVWRTPGDSKMGVFTTDTRPDVILMNAFSYCKQANPNGSNVPMVMVWLEKAPKGKTIDYDEAADDALMLLHTLSVCLISQNLNGL